MEHLSQLQSKHGIAAIMGNHDGWSNSRDYYRKTFTKAGIPFLINQNTQLDINGTPLHIAGTDYVWLGSPDPAKTLKGIPTDSPVIALVHEPDYFDSMRTIRDIDLQLSGHTHGGQCRVPFIGYAPVKVKYGENYVYGYYQEGNSQLFVSRGTGTSGMRVRFACAPELVILTLRCAT
jgi:predicted MPP superfamily phosphohydrolase